VASLSSGLDADVLVAGGIDSLAGISALRDAGVSGVILGEAFFTGRLDLGEALRAAA
jgi:phosphoribosylformimino-5-aminoimidazole carboxamide ribonucleotide (ProFAR) isomerase